MPKPSRKKKSKVYIGWYMPCFDHDVWDEGMSFRLWKQVTSEYMGHKVRITIEDLSNRKLLKVFWLA